MSFTALWPSQLLERFDKSDDCKLKESTADSMIILDKTTLTIVTQYPDSIVEGAPLATVSQSPWLTLA